MHEILAIILWCTDLDSVGPAPSAQDRDTLGRLVLAREYVDHDAYSLFNILMTSMLSWYDHTSSVSCWVGNNNGYQTTAGTTLVQPIVAKCARVHDLLKKVDFELWKRMEELKIEPQIYGIRWLRLLFSREFPIEASYVLGFRSKQDDNILDLGIHLLLPPQAAAMGSDVRRRSPPNPPHCRLHMPGYASSHPREPIGCRL